MTEAEKGGAGVFIIPLAHEKSTIRRIPVVTAAIMGACVLVWLVSIPAEKDAEARIDRAAKEVKAFWQVHPYLRSDSRLARGLKPSKPPRPLAELSEQAGWSIPEPPAAELEAEQAELAQRTAAFEAAVAEHPAHRFGWVPSRPRWPALLTHMFLHGGILHLLANLWFFWLSGCNLEDRWGRAVYAGFYVACGVAAALTHTLLCTDPTLAVIGASGAVAGAMGGFLVVHARAKIRLGYLYWLALTPRFGTFQAPAWAMLPIWALVELFWAYSEAHAGVGHWAHVGGFGFGAIAALGLRVSGLDAKLDRAIEKAGARKQSPELLAAAGLVDSGKPDEALQALDDLSRRDPRNIDVQLELLRAAERAGSSPRRRTAYARLVSLYLAQDMKETALDLFREACVAGLDGEVLASDRALLEPTPPAARPAAPPRAMGGIAMNEPIDSSAPELFDVVVRTVPTIALDGTPFVPALAQAFGIDPAMAARVAREAPVVVKRAVTREAAAGMERVLTKLGATVDLVPKGSGPISTPPSRRVSAPPPSAGIHSLPAAPRSQAPRGSPGGRLAAAPRSSAGAGDGVDAAAESAPVPPPKPIVVAMPPPERTLPTIPRGLLAAVVVVALGLGFYAVFRYFSGQSAQRLLGNTPLRESLCATRNCLESAGPTGGKPPELTLIVAWRDGCLDAEYSKFLRSVASRYPRDRLTVVGVVRTVPASGDMRGVGLDQRPPPREWPDPSCDPGFPTVPPSSGRVDDFLAPPVTYLIDSDGTLLAVWRGGMSPPQRGQLDTWLKERF